MFSLRVTGNVLRRLHSFHPVVDIPQICLSYVTFAEGWTVFHLSTSESVLISNSDTWMGTQSRHLARGGTLLNRPIINMNKHHSPGGATIGYVRLGSPICNGIIIHCTFSSCFFVLPWVCVCMLCPYYQYIWWIKMYTTIRPYRYLLMSPPYFTCVRSDILMPTSLISRQTSGGGGWQLCAAERRAFTICTQDIRFTYFISSATGKTN